MNTSKSLKFNHKQTLEDIKYLKTLGFDYALEKKGFLRVQQYYTNQQYPISSALNNKLKTATNSCMSLFQEAYTYVANNIIKYEDTFISLGYHPDLIKAFINANPDPVVSNLSRIDFLVDDQDQIKFCEINSATPQGVYENVVCSQYFKSRYNTITLNDNLLDSFKHMWSDLLDRSTLTTPTLYVSCEGSYNEDVQTVMLHTETYTGDVQFIDLKDIKVTEDGVFTDRGTQIELMFMLYPIEFLPHDKDEDGFDTGSLFLEHISNGIVQMVNPLSATLIQSKNFVTVIDQLVQDKKLSKDSIDIYKTYFPKSAIWNGTREQIENWLDKDSKVVLKPVFGRTGKAVQIVTKDTLDQALDYIGKPKNEDMSWYLKQPHILQEYCPDRNANVVLLDKQEHSVNLIFGAYAVDLQYSGLYIRGDEGCTTDQCILLHPVEQN